jgi:hypothetical protein
VQLDQVPHEDPFELSAIVTTIKFAFVVYDTILIRESDECRPREMNCETERCDFWCIPSSV